MQTEQFSTLESLIKNNLGAGFVFKKLTEEKPHLCPVKTAVPMVSTVSLVWKKGLGKNPTTRIFADFVKENINV